MRPLSTSPKSFTKIPKCHQLKIPKLATSPKPSQKSQVASIKNPKLSTSPKPSQKSQVPSIKNPKLSTSPKPSQKSQVPLINITSLCKIIWAYVQMAPTPARVN
jgi:hypothetical protein